MTEHLFRAFGRDQYSDEVDGPWWPLYHREGPILAESAEAAIEAVTVRLAAGEPQWIEVAVVPLSGWYAAATATSTSRR